MKISQTFRIALCVCLLVVMNRMMVNAQITFSPEKIIAQSEVVFPTTIKAADLTGNGYLDILVLSEQGYKLSWFKNNGENNFDKILALYQVVDAGSPAPTIQNFYLADLDTDGDQDLLLHTTSGNIFWLANNGSGTFGLPQNITVADFINHIHITDLNTDGYPDLIAHLSGSIVWLANDGTGNFAAPQTLVSAAPTGFFTTADINGDGFLDLLADRVPLPGGGLGFVWYANDGTGNLGTQQFISMSSYFKTIQATADLDNDGDMDLVISYSVDGSGLSNSIVNLAWLQNNGAGSFSAPQIILSYNQTIWYEPSVSHLSNFQITDYDNNGLLDILFLTVWWGYESPNNSDFSAWFNYGSNLYATAVNSSSGPGDCIDHTFYAADFDNNGSVDLASAIVQEDQVSVNLSGLPTIKLTNPEIAKHIQYFELSDINNDNSPDAVILSQYLREDVTVGDLYWKSNDNSGNFLSDNSIYDYSCNMLIATYKNILCAADFTGDGAVDYVFQNEMGDVIFLENYGGGNFSSGIGGEIDIYTSIYSGAHAVDIDNDGDLDLVCYAQNGFGFPDYVYWYANDGTGVFSEPVILFASAPGIIFTDVNNDNLPDAIVGGSTVFYWIQNLGGGSFGSLQLINTGITNRKTADLNGDGNIDIIGLLTTTGETVWLAGDGTGNFAPPVILPTILDAIVALEDLDIDGDIDIVTGNNNQLNWHANNGNALFSTAQFIANATPDMSYLTNMVRMGDIDSDGDWDIAVVCQENGSAANKVVWYENTNLSPGEPLMPIAAFTTFPSPVANPDTLVICQGQPVQFINQSQNSNAFWWDFGNGASSTNSNPTYTYPEPGTYTVQLTAYNNLPENLECQANVGTPSFGIEGGFFGMTNYNTSPNYTFTFLTFNLNGEQTASTNNLSDLYAPTEDAYVVAVNYLPTEVIPANTLSELQAQEVNGECIDYYILDKCGIKGTGGYPVYNAAYGGYLIRLSVANGLSCTPPTCQFYGYPAISYDDFSFLVPATAVITNTDNQAFPFGSTITICPTYNDIVQCCQEITIPDGPPPIEAPRPARKPSGLSDSTSLVIVVEPAFAPDISCASTVCEGTIAEYSTSADCETYNWTITGGNLISGQGTPAITVEWTTPSLGSISLSAECGEEYCSLPTVVAIPIIGSTADIQGQTFFCANDVLQYSAPYFGGTQYLWSINPPTAGTILTGQSTNLIAIQWNDAPATITLTYQNDLLNCGGAATLVVTPKPSFAINPITPVCEGSTTTVSANSLLPFVWSVSGGEVLSGQNTNAITVLWSTAGTATVSALPVNPDAFCNATSQASATVVPYPQTPTISGATTVCPLQTYTYTAAPIQVNTQFIWSVEGGTITAGQNSPTVSVQWNDTPPYLLSVVRQTLTGTVCTSEPATLSPTPLADSPFTIFGNTNACPNSLQTYQITPTLIGAFYTWTVNPPDAALIAQGQGTEQVSLLFGNTPNTNLTLSAAYCNLTAELVIDIGALPQPSILQTDTLCTGSNIVLSVADLGTGTSYTGYLWKNAANTTISTLPTATITNEGVYSLQVTNASGCVAIATHRVYQYTSPVAKILASGNTNICIQFPTDIELYAIDGTNYAFEWTVDDMPIPGTNSPFLTHSGNGVEGSFPYRVLVTDTSNTCSVWSNLLNIHHVNCSGGVAPPDTVIVPPPPPMNCPPIAGYNIDFTISATSTNCNTVTLNATTSGDFTGFSVHWGEGSLQPFDGISETHTYSSSQVNIYKITLVAYFIHPVTGQPCFKTLTKTHEVPLAARFDMEPACLGNAWKFQDRSYYLPTTSITQWIWDFGDGTPPFSGTQTEMHTFTNPGTYTATLTITDGSCTVSSSVNYTVSPLPTAQFTVSGGNCAGNAHSFIPNDTDLVAYFWQFGNGAASGLPNPVYTYTAAGDYTVSLQTLNQQGCYSALQTQTISLADAPEPQPLTASDTLFCAGLSATLTAPVGGTAYLWSSGQTTPSVSVVTSGNYSVQVTLPWGCVYTSPAVNIQVIAAPSATISPASPVMVCQGTGGATLQVPSNPNYTYTWSQVNNGLPYNTFLNGGTKTVTVTDTTTGCSAVGSAQVQIINNPTPPSITASAIQLCEGQSANIAIAAPNPQYTYSWTNGATGTSIIANTTGTYGAFSVNSNGCVSDTSFLTNISFVALPNAAAFPAGCYAICPDEPITLPPNTAETYQWYFNGIPLPDATGNSWVPQAEGAYWVEMTNAPNCTLTTDVLQLEFSTNCSGPLPVSLVSFTGTVQPNGNLLQWTTASELNSAYFTLQQSPNGIAFTDLARLTAAGNSSNARHYQHLHLQPYPLTYYRLLQTDFDGSIRQAGNVITLVRPQQQSVFAITQIAPVPTHDLVYITYSTPTPNPTTLHLYDLTGRLLFETTLPSDAGSNTYHLEMRHLANGLYVVALNNGEQIVTGKVVKE